MLLISIDRFHCKEYYVVFQLSHHIILNSKLFSYLILESKFNHSQSYIEVLFLSFPFVLPPKYIGTGIFHLSIRSISSYCVSESESFSKLIHFPSLERHCLLGGGPALRIWNSALPLAEWPWVNA